MPQNPHLASPRRRRSPPLIASCQLPGVIWLMIGPVAVQIIVVWAWGVEPRDRGLEDVAAKA